MSDYLVKNKHERTETKHALQDVILNHLGRYERVNTYRHIEYDHWYCVFRWEELASVAWGFQPVLGAGGA